MRTASKQLRLNREVVRELSNPALAGAVGAQASLSNCCTGMETITLVCCLTNGCQSVPLNLCLTGTETATNICC